MKILNAYISEYEMHSKEALNNHILLTKKIYDNGTQYFTIKMTKDTMVVSYDLDMVKTHQLGHTLLEMIDMQPTKEP